VLVIVIDALPGSNVELQTIAQKQEYEQEKGISFPRAVGGSCQFGHDERIAVFSFQERVGGVGVRAAEHSALDIDFEHGAQLDTRFVHGCTVGLERLRKAEHDGRPLLRFARHLLRPCARERSSRAKGDIGQIAPACGVMTDFDFGVKQ
jgi:hypothetical protein